MMLGGKEGMKKFFGNIQFFMLPKEAIRRNGLFGTLGELKQYFKVYKNWGDNVRIPVDWGDYFRIYYSFNRFYKFKHWHGSVSILEFVPPRLVYKIVYEVFNTVKINDKIEFYRVLSKNSIPLPETKFYIRNGKSYNFDGKICKSFPVQDGEELFIKPISGMQGRGITKVVYSAMDALPRGDFLFQKVYKNHKDMSKLGNKKALNTIRMLTFLNNEREVVIISSYLKIGGGGITDHLVKGGIGLLINQNTGIIERSGLRLDGTVVKYSYDDSGILFQGFKVPFWDDVTAMVEKAHRLFPMSRVIGWDIGITDNGPIIVEGNTNAGMFSSQIIAGPLYKSVFVQEFLMQGDNKVK